MCQKNFLQDLLLNFICRMWPADCSLPNSNLAALSSYKKYMYKSTSEIMT